MVNVSLYQLVLVRGTRHLWPDWFRTFCDKVEQDPSDRGNFLIAADKSEEEGEVELASILKWFGNHPEVLLTDELSSRKMDDGFWLVSNLPPALRPYERQLNQDENDERVRVFGNPLYRIARVGSMIEEVRSQL